MCLVDYLKRNILIGFYKFFSGSKTFPYSMALTFSRLKYIGLLNGGGGLPRYFFSRRVLWMICSLTNF